jgi:2',3'-cyclic-nucleotide 2'-phosphodiesterase (5'-nucleotidase family)
LLFPVIFAYYCGGTYQKPISENISSVESQNIVIDSTLTPDSLLEVFINPYRSELNRTMGVVIGHTNSDLFKGKPEAPLNNFVADLMLKRANRDFNKPVDAAITNVGGLRINIPRGPITVGKIYEVMPFENELVVLELSGQQLWELGEELGQVNGEPVAGMQLKYLDKKIVQFKIQGNDVRKDKIYFIVTTDYLQKGEINSRFLVKHLELLSVYR